MTSEGFHRPHDSHLSKRLARRGTVLQVAGVLLMLLACAVEWAPPEDPALPPTRPFLLMLGLLVFVTGRVLRWEWAHGRPADHPGPLVTTPPPDDRERDREAGSR